MNFTKYPETNSRKRPYFIEIHTHDDGKQEVRMFCSHYFYSEKQLKLLQKDEPFISGEGHPWNLNVYQELTTNPNSITLWKESMLQFVIDAMNDKYEREIYPAITNAEPA